MKKALLIILALILILGFTAGCGNNDNIEDGNDGAAVITDSNAEDDDEALRSSAGFMADALISGLANVSLEDVNIIDPDDEESFRAGMGISPDELVLVSER